VANDAPAGSPRGSWHRRRARMVVGGHIVKGWAGLRGVALSWSVGEGLFTKPP